ncbi:MAG: tetratricopeptide repeat protein [Patescibacteria group bacterium]|nr:tetratricopeptide repeat protein [bacterium]MDZ4240668.1 tetratricopeptide repeat protein [Patescibacteria group bacterium]
MDLPKTYFDIAPQKKSPFSFEGVSTTALMVLVFLLPLFFASTPLFSFQFSKSFLVSVGVIVSLAFFLLSVLKNGTTMFPYHPVIAALLGVLFTTFLSSLFSGAPFASLVGYGFEMGTFSFVTLLALLLILSVVIFRSKEKIFYTYLVFFASFFAVALFNLLRFIFGPDLLSFGVFTSIFSNTVGKWNELGVFFGIIVILSLVSLEMVRLTRVYHILLWVSLGLSLVFLTVINFSTIWVLLAAFALIFFVYILTATWSTSVAEGARQARVSWISLGLLIFSLVFVLGGRVIGDSITRALGLSTFEVRPSWSTTIDVAWQTFKQNPVFGSGPNRFATQWNLYKPESVNATNFWNTSFSYGVGVIPTSLVTGGVIGTAAWLAFIGLLLYTGFKALFSKEGDPFSKYLVTSSFLVSLYLWAIAIFYVPGITIFALTFFFSGLFLAALAEQNMFPIKTISFLDNPRISFLSILLIVFLLLGTVSYGYLVLRSGFASYYFQQGSVAFAQGNLDAAETALNRVLSIEGNDAYYRAMSEINLSRLQQIAARTDVPAESLRTDFQQTLGVAIENATRARDKDRTNPQNWVALGHVYQVLVSLGVEGAYESTQMAYTEAVKRSPHDPSLQLEFARLELAKGDNKKAKEFIAKALQQKQNYTEAVFLLSQIEVSEGNVNGAIDSVEKATLLAPNDPALYFQLGLLKYNKRDYKGAIGAFERAVTVNSQYANARYFLGLSYYQDRRINDAIAQFEVVRATNPNNEEVKLILSNLKAGKEPFANATPPVDNEPEKRDTLPVDEETVKAEE